ncbi:hypothetical protein ACOSQ2_011161 [Xanthoceras sorbifolium]
MVHMLLDSFEPIHGILLFEGEDIDPSLYEAETSGLSQEEMEKTRRLHTSDTSIDKEKYSIELRLAKLCLERNIPYLGICRGSQVVIINVHHHSLLVLIRALLGELLLYVLVKGAPTCNVKDL